MCFYFGFYNNRNRIQEYEKYTPINGTVQSFEFKTGLRARYGASKTSFHLKLKEYQNSFALSSITRKSLKKDLFIDEIKKGDKIILFIPPSSALNRYTIEIGQLEKNGFQYVDETVRNQKRRHNSNGGLFAGSVFIAIMFIEWIRNKKRSIRKF